MIVTDAWHPQVNGVVRTLSTVGNELRATGHMVEYLTPLGFRSVPCPTYPEIRLAVTSPSTITRKIESYSPTALHIATEGPLGFLARRYARKRGWPYTTSFHTRFPEYINARFRLPADWGYPAIRWFHSGAQRVMAPSPSITRALELRGFRNIVLWNRGVDTALFQPGPRPDWAADWPRPIMLYVGRVAVEKDLPDFLGLKRPGTKVVVGDGPARAELEKAFPDARFLGTKFGEELADAYRAADVFVFPSKTDTFGLVMLEALATGVPVAAYPVIGPVDIIGSSAVGCLNEDLDAAVDGALEASRGACRAYAETFSWQVCAEQFHGFLAPFG